MEDLTTASSVSLKGHPASYFGVFDGHYGTKAVEYTAKMLYKTITDTLPNGPEGGIIEKNLIPTWVLKSAFTKVNKAFLEESESSDKSGSTATIAILTGTNLHVSLNAPLLLYIYNFFFCCTAKFFDLLFCIFWSLVTGCECGGYPSSIVVFSGRGNKGFVLGSQA